MSITIYINWIFVRCYVLTLLTLGVLALLVKRYRLTFLGLIAFAVGGLVFYMFLPSDKKVAEETVVKKPLKHKAPKAAQSSSVTEKVHTESSTVEIEDGPPMVTVGPPTTEAPTVNSSKAKDDVDYQAIYGGLDDIV